MRSPQIFDKRTKYLYLLPLTIMGIIFYLSHQPNVMDGMPEIPFLDKFFHFTAYFALGFSFCISLSFNRWPRWGPLSFLFTMLYAMSDEIHQTFVPNRSFEVSDFLADVFGGLVAVLVFRYLMRTFSRLPQSRLMRSSY